MPRVAVDPAGLDQGTAPGDIDRDALDRDLSDRDRDGGKGSGHETAASTSTQPQSGEAPHSSPNHPLAHVPA